MTDPIDTSSPTQKAQSEYDLQVNLLRGMHGKNRLSFELATHELLGHNSLKLLLNKFGNYDSGLIADSEYDEHTRDRLLALIKQDSVTTVAIATSLLKNIYTINSTLKTIKWLLITIIMLLLLVIVFK